MQWKRSLDNDGKRDTYTNFKDKIIHEPYLDEITNECDRQNLTRLIISSHRPMWRSWLTRQSAYPKVVGSSPAGGEKLAVGRTFSGQSYKRFVPLAMHLTPPR